MKRTAVVFIVAIGVSLGGCKKPAEPTTTAPVRVTNVAVAPIVPREAEARIVIPATVEAWATVTLSAEVDGRVETIAGDEGDTVGARQVLFEVNAATLRAQLRSAEAALTLAQQTYDRAEALRRDKTIPQAEYDRARADRLVAKANVDLAKVKFEKATVRSPISGILNRRYVEVGEFVNPGAPLGEVVDTSKVKVVAPVAEKDIPFVTTGDRIAVTLGALGITRTGTVIYQSQAADPQTLTFDVKIALSNPGGMIRPGMIARVALVRARVPKAIKVPIFAIVRRDEDYVAFVENDGTAHARPVELGFFDGQYVVVRDGLNVGDRLIVEGHRDLVDGDRVKVLRVITPAGSEGVTTREAASASDRRRADDSPPRVRYAPLTSTTGTHR